MPHAYIRDYFVIMHSINLCVTLTLTYLEMSPQYHSASSSRLTISPPFGTELDGPSILAVWTSDLVSVPDFDCSDNLGGRGGRTVINTVQYSIV